MISFRENFFGNEMSAIKKKQEEQKKKMMEAQQNVKEKVESGKKLGGEIKVKVEDWLRGKKGEPLNKLSAVTDLKTRWLLAQQQKKESTELYNKAEKDWYTFSKGGLWYQNYLEDKAGKSLNNKKGNIQHRFDEKIAELEKLIKIYKDKNDNKINVEGANNKMQAESNELAEKVNFGRNLKNVNNRMSDWYEKQNEFYENLNWYISKFYWISLIVMSVLVLIKFKLENKKLLAVIALFIILPFLTNTAAAWLFNLHSNNCPSFIPSLGFESGGSKTCQIKAPVRTVDCEMGPWGPCSKTCGGGIMKRQITTPPMNGGRPCDDAKKACNTQACEVGEDPSPPPPGKPPPPPTENVLVQMTKDFWNGEYKRKLIDLGKAKLKNEGDLCKKDNKRGPKMPTMPTMPSMPKIPKMDVPSAKELAEKALNKASRIKDKAELLADTAAQKAGAISDDITSKTEDRFDIIQSECLGKYCR